MGENGDNPYPVATMMIQYAVLVNSVCRPFAFPSTIFPRLFACYGVFSPVAKWIPPVANLNPHILKSPYNKVNMTSYACRLVMAGAS